jgi:hypothetical protein
MSNRNLGIAILVIGILIILISLLADVISIGATAGVMGWKQILGAGIGLFVCIAGIVISRRK